MVMVVQCLLIIQNPTAFPSPGSQEQILPNMVSSSTDLHHRVADINKGDIIYAGMVAVHTRCLLYCLHVVCIWWTQVARGCLAEDFRYLSWFWNLVLVCSVSRSKRRAAHKISLGEQVRVEKSLCIALHRSSSCSNFHRLKTYILLRKNSLAKIRLELINNLY